MPALFCFILLSLSAVLRAGDGAPARYVGGTVAALKGDTSGSLHTTDELFLEFRARGRQHVICYETVNLIEYGQNVSRRIALAMVISPLFVLSKARKHYLSIGYTDENGKQEAMVFQIDKAKIRAVLVALEARTGLKVTYQDDEARKAGKG